MYPMTASVCPFPTKTKL